MKIRINDTESNIRVLSVHGQSWDTGRNNKNDTSVNEGSVSPTQLDVKYEGQ